VATGNNKNDDLVTVDAFGTLNKLSLSITKHPDDLVSQDIYVSADITEPTEVKVSSAGAFSVGGKKLLALLNRVKGKYIKFSVIDSLINIDYAKGKTFVTEDFGSSRKKSTNTDITNGIAVFVNEKMLGEGITSPLSYAHNDPTNILSNVILEFEDGNLSITGTDKTRMCSTMTKIESFMGGTPTTGKFVVSSDFIQTIKKLLSKTKTNSQATLRFTDTRALCFVNEFSVISKLIDSRELPDLSSIKNAMVLGSVTFTVKAMLNSMDSLRKSMGKLDDYVVLKLDTKVSKAVLTDDSSEHTGSIFNITMQDMVVFPDNGGETDDDNGCIFLEFMTKNLSGLFKELNKSVTSVTLNLLGLSQDTTNTIKAGRITLNNSSSFICVANRI